MSANLNLDILAQLVMTIEARSIDSKNKSYTANLLNKGVAHCAKKFGEEAVETVIASVSEDDNAVISEASDVLFHLLVLLRARNISLQQVMIELDSRTRQSGLQEKASRSKN